MCATDVRPGPVWRTAWPRAAVLALAATVLSASAQTQPSREQELIRRLRQQVQQLQAELATAQQAAQAARADADRRTGSAQAEAARARRSVGAGAARIQALEAELATLGSEHQALQARATGLAAELERDREALAQARARLGADGLRLQRREGELEALQARFKTQNAALELCARQNQALRDVSLELLQRWQRTDWLDALAAKEPFVQASRVRIENLVQGYEEQIDRASLEPRPAQSTPGAVPRP